MRRTIEDIIKKAAGNEAVFDVLVPEESSFGHYSTNVAMRLGKKEKKDPMALGEEIAGKIRASSPKGFFEKVEVAQPGFINFWLTPQTIQKELEQIAGDLNYGRTQGFRGKRVLVEYTDPNPFKQFHIGHLMTNVIGESIARLLEISGAEVLRLNYQGDVGVHVAASIWGMSQMENGTPKESDTLVTKAEFLGRAYARGAAAYKDDPAVKTEIDELNKKIYERSDPRINKLYDQGKKWSLDYFETLYARLGTKFDNYFFESAAGPEGAAIVREHPEVFTESEGAVIFEGEKYGLHNRVFITKLNLPTYEAKELGINKKKFDLYHPDLSLIVTGNEINEYFKVLLKAMELTIPEAAAKTRHLGHGMLRLPTGKMSSRTGDVITAESLIDRVKELVAEKVKGREGLTDEEREEICESVALAAIRYSILRQGIGRDVIFDMESSVAFTGDSGPYLQYTYARLRSILRKAESEGEAAQSERLETEQELALIRKLIEFPDVVSRSAAEFAPNAVATYLHELADMTNGYYESTPILSSRGGEEDQALRNARLLLIGAVASVLKKGLRLLGVGVPERI